MDSLHENFCLNVLDPNGYIPINRSLIHALGLFEAVVFSELLSQYKYYKSHKQLQDDGSFFAPEGAWPKEEIADIDMKRWMSKSIAFVELTDGSRVKLDDYIFRDTHLIVGALASQRYPEQWDEQAKPARKEELEEDQEWDEEGLEDEDEADETPEMDADPEKAPPEA